MSADRPYYALPGEEHEIVDPDTLAITNEIFNFGVVFLNGVRGELKMVLNGMAANFDGVEVRIPIETIDLLVKFVAALKEAKS